ncbi:MAG: type I DNA topoisomerase [Gammaproteobacteria bacterium]|nr:type I DNA topoisomerase [Gammaproteobacteria bacterium]
MTTNLVIVESPAKSKTIKKYLGKDFLVLASYGHVRDLLPKKGAVDPEHKFAMHYEIIEKNAKHVAEISKALKSASALYLATDPDREGEAISWHLTELLKEKKILKKQPIYRIVFHEITKSAIQEALAHPRDISMELVDAQQARRALDYLVGFNLSPLLWKKVRPGLSAGRVQSPALRMIVEREEEIEKFKPEEYWTITADVAKDAQNFSAKLIEYDQQKITQFSVTNKDAAAKIKDDLINAAQGKLKIIKVEKKQRQRHPAPPFTTSTLQQEAGRKLGFTAKRTMRTAQQLYEGMDIGSEGSVGLITYMRTDSVNLANDALAEIRNTISERFGKENLPDQPKFYKTKSKNAQEAHEAIRPTATARTPESLANFLNPDQLKLYTLIWKRTVACQMISATLDTVTVDLGCGEKNTFRANGSSIVIPGFIAVYHEGQDDAAQDADEKMLPPLKVGDLVDLLKINDEQHFTEPPPRYTEASLIKTLEEYGIGRPSTYATIIDTIIYREYVILDNKRFKPTDVGRVVIKFLTTYFSQYVDYEFTAKLEDELDEIARGENKFLNLLKKFWDPFKKLVANIEATVQRKDVTQEQLEEKCPECGKPLTSRLGKNGKFIGCSGYPECKYTRNIDQTSAESSKPEIIPDRLCPLCNSPLQIKFGRYGKFIGCTNYPNCKHMEPLEKPQDTGIVCPVCKTGKMLKRKSRYGKYFFSCSEYPKCKYATWNEPIAEKCPKCGWPILTIKTTKRKGREKVCPQKECGFSEPME